MSRLLAERYYTLHRRPGYNVKVNALTDYRIMHQWTAAEMDRKLGLGDRKAIHVKTAELLAKQAVELNREWAAVTASAVAEHGAQGSLISGVYRDHFPDAVKERLRHLAHNASDCASASVNHWRAAGRRVGTWSRMYIEANNR